jgi:hydrogenase expression/formation protein HypD
MEAILDDEFCQIDAFLGAGHVCAIMGYKEYIPLAEQYRVPIVITGFEPLDLAEGIYRAVAQLEKGEYRVENQYSRVVKEEGNLEARKVIERVFEVTERQWRGIGSIPESGLDLREEYSRFNASKKFDIHPNSLPEHSNCIAGEVLRGIKKPHECSQFGKACTPASPIGAPMVSSEGACAAYYHYAKPAE